MAKIETEILSRSKHKPLVWKCYTDDIFSLWNTSRGDIQMFIDLANNRHQTIKFTAEISTTETFLDTTIYKGERFRSENILTSKLTSKQQKILNIHIFAHHPTTTKRGFC